MCSIFMETYVKYSQTLGPSKCAALISAQHIFSPAKLFQNMISQSVHHLDTAAGIIRVLTRDERAFLVSLSRVPGILGTRAD